MHEEVRTHPLISIHDSATVGEAARLMADCSAGLLGVLDTDRRFAGIFTERDLTQFVSEGGDPTEARMSEVLNDFPVTVDAPVTRAQAAERMRAAHIRHLIVRMPDGEHRILSMRDLYLTYAIQRTPEPSEIDPLGLPLTASDVMSTPAVACRPDALIEEVAEILADRDISGMPVLSEIGDIIGVVSERDVAHALGSPLVRLALRRHPHDDLFLRRPHGMEFEGRRAFNIMSQPAIVEGASTSLADLAETMLQKGINRLPIVEEGRLIGIATRGDVLHGLAVHERKQPREVEPPKMVGAAHLTATRPTPYLGSMGIRA